ncbi:hypothetical protein E2C01_059422 [Portunus trituberculatus]|uniref:Uncharacterized protein n=1 Tax=Portunus trituberculatus TaxID=210409 RepID=A0A5B7H618_PORTR|nr:hypothetical protein [Portunus trituberculatus]
MQEEYLIYFQGRNACAAISQCVLRGTMLPLPSSMGSRVALLTRLEGRAVHEREAGEAGQNAQLLFNHVAGRQTGWWWTVVALLLFQ